MAASEGDAANIFPCRGNQSAVVSKGQVREAETNKAGKPQDPVLRRGAWDVKVFPQR